MDDKRLKILSPEQKRRRKNNIISAFSFILIVGMIGGLIYVYATNHDNNKHISKGDVSTTTTTTTTEMVVTLERDKTTAQDIKTVKTQEYRGEGVQTVFATPITDPVNTTEPTTNPVVNDRVITNTTLYVYNFQLKDDKYKLSICNSSSNALLGKYNLYLNDTIIARSGTIDDEVLINKDTLDLSTKPNIFITIEGNQHEVSYSSKCIVS